jgi:hypothetical protein
MIVKQLDTNVLWTLSGGVLDANWANQLFNFVLLSTETAITIDSSTNSHDTAKPAITIVNRPVTTVSSYIDQGVIDLTRTFESTSSNSYLSSITVRFNSTGSIANKNMYGLLVDNGGAWSATNGPNVLYAVEFNLGGINAYGVNSKPPKTVIGLNMEVYDTNTIASYTAVVLSSLSVVSTTYPIQQPRGVSAFYEFGVSANFASYTALIHYGGVLVDSGVTLNYAGNGGVSPFRIYTGELTFADGTGVLSNGFAFCSFDSTAEGGTHILGTINGNEGIVIYRGIWRASDTVTTNSNLIFAYANLDVSGTTISGYASGLSVIINGNNKTFPVYGSKITITGTMGAGAVWKGHYLDATGVTCGVGRTFYGLHINMAGMGVGGTIYGIKVDSGSVVVTGNGQSIQLPNMTTGNRPSPASAGMMIFDSTVVKGMVYDGSNWVAMGGGSGAIVLTQMSDPQTPITIPSVAADQTLPSITVPASFFPAGLSVKRVEVILMWRKTENTNGTLNYLSGTQYIQVQKGAGAFTNAIKLVDTELKTPAASDGSGDAFIGSIDVKGTVDADNATYNFKWTSALALLASILLHDVRIGLRFYLG